MPKAIPQAKKPSVKHPMDKDLILGLNVSFGGGKDLTKKCVKGTTCDRYVTHNVEAMFKMLFWKAVFVGVGSGYHSVKSKSETYNLSSTTLTGGLHILFSKHFDVMFLGKLGAVVGRQKGSSKTVGGIHWSVGAGINIPYRPRKAIYRFTLGASYDNYLLVGFSKDDTDMRSINIFAGVTMMY